MVTCPPRRGTKVQRSCSQCRRGCSPKDGDWFLSPAGDSQQVFLCKTCERETLHRKAMPGR